MRDWELTQEEYQLLSDDDKKLYDFAIAHIDDEHAMGPSGGWSRAHDALKKIGYQEQVRSIGNRSFVALVKPSKD